MNRRSTPSLDPSARPAVEAGPTAETDPARLRRRLLGFALKMIWNRQDAEEIVQEAFKLKLAMIKKPGSGRRGSVPWMFRTVANLCLNQRRRIRPEPLTEWVEAPPASSPARQAEQAEQLERVRDAVAALPDQQRTALVLRTMEQMGYADIAKIMGLSAATVRAHVHFARQRLAERLGLRSAETGS